MPDRVYLDWNATTPLRPEARQAMAAAWDLAGNPSSVHAEGRQARRLVEGARAAISGAVGARPQDLVFTSGGTEANALALTPGLRRGACEPAQRLLVSAIEHTSVLSGGRFPPEAIGTIQVTGSGLIELDHLRRLVADGQPALVSVMLANNETGALQPVGEVADIVHEAGGLLHVDAIQALGKIPLAVQECDRHHGDVEIGRGAYRIARQDTQPATIRGHTCLQRDLHREIRNGSISLHACDSLIS